MWRFGQCSFDELRHELRVRGEVADLEAKPLEVLHQLLLRAGEVVSKEDLLESVWPGVMVVDASLATAVSKLRKALGDQDSIIKTVPKLGYRFAAPVRSEWSATLPVAPVASPVLSVVSLDQEQNRIVGVRGIGRVFGRRLAASVIALVVMSCAGTALLAYKKAGASNAVPGPVAVLPFQNGSSTTDLDYLRLALPDQVATALSAARSLSIRPIAASNRYSDAAVDMRTVGRELDVNHVVTGRYVLIGDQLQVTMEAVDTKENRVVWRDTVNVPVNNLLALQAQVVGMSRGKLTRALGVADLVKDSEPAPTNEEAYGLYLRSLALDWDPAPNKQGIELLRRSVQLDPTYAPAWSYLSVRYYRDSRFGGGGAASMQLSDAAAERLFALDPGAPDAVAELTLHRAERGELVKAHRDAVELVRRRPDNPNNHHVLSYVLRYGGSIEEAGRECDEMALLAAKIVWGSCSITFRELGNYQRAKDFIRKDRSSEWSNAQEIELLLREGKNKEAIQIGAPKIAHWASYKMLLACAQHAPESEIQLLASGVEVDDDPEANYFFAGHLAFCGRAVESLRWLKLAIDANYCAYPAMDRDPFFDKIRKQPEFLKLRAAGMACHEAFVANREQAPRLSASVDH